jgi:hypothetical protein
MENDDRQVGRILTRREVIRLLGAAGAAILVGCGPEQSGSEQPAASGGTPTLNVEAQTVEAVEGAPTAEVASATTAPACVVRPELTEGPYFVDVGLNRSDIRSDPATGVAKEGVLLALAFNVSQVSNSSCSPLEGSSLTSGTVTRWAFIRPCPILASTPPSSSSYVAIR